MNERMKSTKERTNERTTKWTEWTSSNTISGVVFQCHNCIAFMHFDADDECLVAWMRCMDVLYGKSVYTVGIFDVVKMHPNRKQIPNYVYFACWHTWIFIGDLVRTRNHSIRKMNLAKGREESSHTHTNTHEMKRSLAKTCQFNRSLSLAHTLVLLFTFHFTHETDNYKQRLISCKCKRSFELLQSIYPIELWTLAT